MPKLYDFTRYLFAVIIVSVFVYFANVSNRFKKVDWLGRTFESSKNRNQVSGTEIRSVQLGNVDNIEKINFQEMAHFVPHFEQGEKSGFILFSVVKKSLLEKMDITDGDVLTEINGTQFSDLLQLKEVGGVLASNHRVQFTIVRDHRQMFLNISSVSPE